MLRRTYIVALLALAGLALPLAADLLAQWAYRSPEEIAYASDLVVCGKLSDKKMTADNGSASATLTVRKVIKGDANLRDVSLQMAGGKLELCGGDIAYKGDEDGLWFLEKVEKNGKVYYTASYPTRFISTVGMSEAQLNEKLEWAAKLVQTVEPKPVALQDCAKTIANGTVVPGVFRMRCKLDRKLEKHGAGEAAHEYPQWYLVDGETRLKTMLDYRFVDQAEAALKANAQEYDVLTSYDHNRKFTGLSLMRCVEAPGKK